MEDAEPSAPAEMPQRRSSALSRRRPSHTQSQTSTPARSTLSLSQKSERPSGPSAIPLPRARLNSIATRGVDLAQAIVSPLAQVFQPLVVDDDRDGDADALSQDGGGGGGALVSYGPASRRRLTSMARRPTAMAHGDFFGAAAGQAGISRRSPGQAVMTSPGSRMGMTGQALSSSPETRETTRTPEKERDARSGQGQGSSRLHEPLETAAEEQAEGAPSPTDRRLEEIERRQQRIEELLEKLVARAQ